MRLAVHHPLRERLADARPLLHPHRGRRPEPLHLGRLAEDRHPVGRQRDEPVDRVLHADRLVADDLRHQVERVGQLRVEVRLRERELGRRERRRLDRRDLLGVVEDRAVRVRADLEARPVLALVHEHVHVADDRELDRARALLEPRHRPDVDHLVHHRRERDVRAGHRARAAGSRRRRRSRPSRPRSSRARCGRAGSGRRSTSIPETSVFAKHRQRARLDRALAHDRARRAASRRPRRSGSRSRRAGSTRRCTGRAP